MKTGRTTNGTLATRPTCPGQAQPGDEYRATDQIPVQKSVCDSVSGWLALGAAGAIIPNVPLAFSATPVFATGPNVSYTMTLTGNVTSSTTSGTPPNGALLSLTLIQDATGGWTFAFPTNFALASGTGISLSANTETALIFKYDGTNWKLVSNSGSGGGGGTSGAVNNDIHNGAVITNKIDTQYKGQNPYVDVRAFGARAFQNPPTATCTTTASSTAATIGTGFASFVNGDGFTCLGAGATNSTATPAAPTVTPSNASFMMSTGIVVPSPAGAATYQYQIAARRLGGGVTAASAVTVTATGQASLGSQSVNIASWSRIKSTVTVTTASPHTMGAGAQVTIFGSLITGNISVSAGNIDGCFRIASVPDNTHFVFTTVEVGTTTGGAGGTVAYKNGNHISWTAVSGAYEYLIFGRTAGSMQLIGVSWPDSSVVTNVNPLVDTFDDWGSTITTAPFVPAYYPSTPPVSATNDNLSTTIVSGGGTAKIVMAAAATNAVTGSFFTHDNAPNIVNAMQTVANNETKSTLYFPYIPNAGFSFQTFSVMAPGLVNGLSVVQASNVILGDTFIYGSYVRWQGVNSMGGSPSFSFVSNPNLALKGYPGIYEQHVSYWSDVNIIGDGGGNNALMLAEPNGAIPASTYERVNWVTSSSNSDYTSTAWLYRGNNGSTGQATGFFFLKCLFAGGAGPGQVNDASWTPLVQSNNGFGMVAEFRDVFFNRRGFGMRGFPANLNFQWIYQQGGIAPLLSFYNDVGIGASSIVIEHAAIEDTMPYPLLANFGGLSGGARINDSGGPQPGYPMISQTADIASTSGTGNYLILYGNANSAANEGQNEALSYQLQTKMMDGIQGGNTWVNVGEAFDVLNRTVSPGHQISFYNGSATSTPTCTVQSGGTIPAGTKHQFYVIGVFTNMLGNFGEGAVIGQTPVCTTTKGNQTIQIAWTPVTGAVGYDLYDVLNNGSFQCSAPFVSGATTSYTWTGTGMCTGTGPSAPGTGPVNIMKEGVTTPGVKMVGGGFSATLSGNFTANRTQTVPDASGTILLDSTGVSNPGSITQFYDNFNRANGGVGAFYTNTRNTLVVSSDQFTGGTAGAWNSANLTPAGVGYAADQYAAFTLSTIGAGNAQPMVGVRMQAGSLTGYGCGINTNSNTLFLQKFVSGGVSSLKSTAITPAVGDFVLFTVQGTSLTCSRYQNGTLVNTMTNTDPNYLTGTPGLIVFSNASMGKNFNAGNLYPLAHTSQEQDWTAVQHFPFGLTLGNDLGAVITSVPRVIFAGTATLGTSAIASGTCARVVAVAATGVLTTDSITSSFNSDPSVITGYAPSASGSLYITVYPTANNINVNVCNNTAASITPGAATLNVKVIR